MLSIGLSCFIFFLFILFSPDTSHPLTFAEIYCGLAFGPFLVAVGAVGLYTVKQTKMASPGVQANTGNNYLLPDLVI